MNADAIFQILILIFSVVIHEVSHGYAANMLGDKTAEYEGRLTLNPLAHIDPVGSILVPLISYFTGGFIIGWAKPVPFNPYNLRNRKWGEAIVAVAGPASNLVVALIFGLALRNYAALGLNESFQTMFVMITYINVLLAVFNLVPIPPLDGSKILFSVLPTRSGIREVLEKNSFVLVLIFVFFLWKFISPVATILFSLITGYTG